ncbi:MAG: SusD/RagB family nutrient-binding outer membrane lipoprotein, partial [Marinoscillum sp.]
MKKVLIFGLVVFASFACEDLTELNKDIKNPEVVPSGALFANATKDLVDFMTSPSVNVNNFRLWAQFWAQTTYADESNYILNERNVNGNSWNTLYAEVIRDLKDAKALIAEDGNLTDGAKATQTAMAEVLEIYCFHILVDLFGDIPYSEAFTDAVVPKYDDDATIYADLKARLDAAIPSLSGTSGMGDYDLIYGGDADMWAAFANSLKLKLAVRLGDQAMAQAAASAGVFTSNADNFALAYQASTPNTNPLWVSLVQSGRSDYVAASTVVDPMKDLNDPRLPFYFKDQVGGEFVGGIYGDNNTFNVLSHPGALQEDPTFAGVLMGYHEVAFLLAEAAANGWSVGGTATEFYNAGIEASILYWGGTDADVTAYLAQPEVAFATAAGADDFEKIAFQKWISLYDQGFEAWSTVRMYDYPVLPIALQAGIP